MMCLFVLLCVCLCVFNRGSPPLMTRLWRFSCPSSRFLVPCGLSAVSVATTTCRHGSFWMQRGRRATPCSSTPSSDSSSSETIVSAETQASTQVCLSDMDPFCLKLSCQCHVKEAFVCVLGCVVDTRWRTVPPV